MVERPYDWFEIPDQRWMRPMEIIEQVRRRIAAAGLSPSAAARVIGVTPASLEKHLSGGYVRSDSLAKYRKWLAGEVQPTLVPKPPKPAWVGTQEKQEPFPFETPQLRVHEGKPPQHEPYLVVDLFSGCGGMSLGFELLEEGRVFQTVLGLDVEDAMVEAFNANCPTKSASARGICRKVDLTEFLNETEVRAFYLEHLAGVLGDGALVQGLERLPLRPLSNFKALIARLDAQFLEDLNRMRAGAEYRRAYSGLGANVLGQTSVIGFHNALRLPMSSLRPAQLGPLLWVASSEQGAGQDELKAALKDLQSLCRSNRSQLERNWEAERDQLEEKAQATGKGQLASSSQKISEFLTFVDSPPMAEVRKLWVEWRASRDALRTRMFTDPPTDRALSALYTEERHVSVLLGGPPCQGFSRIGRGKLRSLREHGVQVHVDSEAGDERNRLLHKYVLFAAALAPKAFVFENVRHFQAEVKTPEGTFLATEVLEEALRDISRDTLDYRFAMKTVDGSAHLIPQTRERFFMVGLRADVVSQGPVKDVPAWCLSLERRETLPLRTALEGLPPPYFIGGPAEGGANLASTVPVSFQPGPAVDAAGMYLAWVRQNAPRRSGPVRMVDSHHVRSPRSDDQAFFAMMGPGTRWMDYRCDESRTLHELRSVLEFARQAADAARRTGSSSPGLKNLAGVTPERFEHLLASVDGSLSLRLLLEAIPLREGEVEHHLATPGYLGKREGKHGDWLARLDPERPSKTIVSHMGKDTYAYVHPFEPRTLSVREAARIQTFPDWFQFGHLGLVDAFRVIGNAVPPLLSNQLAGRIAQVLWAAESSKQTGRGSAAATG